MKKISILFACLVAVITLNSCTDDPAAVYSTPTEFKLNTPALANQYYELSEDGTLDLSWSQPNYGYAAAAKYRVQVSLDEDFVDTAYVNMTIADTVYVDGSIVDIVYTDTTVMEIVPDFAELTTDYSLCYAQVSEKEIAEAICKLRGIANEDDYTDEPARTVYFRVRAYIGGVEGSDILSNVIKLTQVKEYCAIQSPGYIYLIGNVGGWTGPDAGNANALKDWRLFESVDAIGSKIYSGTFNMPTGQLVFRFYTELTGWDGGASVGTQVEDNPITVDMSSGIYGGALVAPGKGSIQVDNWDGSPMKITVDMNVKSVLLEKVAQ